ncbi:MAG: nickel-dependent hydrogenase large subunit [Chloroflexi bacterium]|nr:nickel-dependent hydrogenase large subunit [Chloroflexota bacterium]
MPTITIDPATRLEGHLKIKANYENGRVTTAESSGMMFRGFENLLAGKDPRDAAVITQRICGVCPTPHAMAAVLAAEQAIGKNAPDNARLVRNLILGADFLHSHILHFYHLTLPSYIQGPAMPPWTPSWNVDLRFTAAENQQLVDHYVQALAVRRQAHEMGALFGGKLPHTAAYEFGGVTGMPKADLITRFRNYLNPIIAFIDNVLLPDANLLAVKYSDYSNIGKGYGNLLAFGVFDLNAAGTSKLLARGRAANGATTIQPVDLNAITEQAKYSWYNDSSNGLNPSKGITQPNADKANAYSWLKAPRFGGVPYETGALARMWVTGDYRRGISVMDRHLARAKEASKIAHAMSDWLGQLNPAAPAFTPMTIPATGTGIGLTEAPRGALGHWLRINERVVASYQILTPTCWNCSPRDNAGVPGPLEKALEGISVMDAAKPIEVQRIVQSYDPCLSCAVH